MPVIETGDGTILADPVVYAELVAYGEDGSFFDPSIVTDTLGLTPTETRRVGDELTRGRTSRHAWWKLTAFPQQVAFYADDVVAAALAPLAGNEDAVTALARSGVRFQVSLVVQSQVAVDENGDPTARDMHLGLSTETIARLASLSFAYSVEQEFWPPDARSVARPLPSRS